MIQSFLLHFKVLQTNYILNSQLKKTGKEQYLK